MTDAERDALIDELLEKAAPDWDFINYWRGVHDRAEAAKRAIMARSPLYGAAPTSTPPNGSAGTKHAR